MKNKKEQYKRSAHMQEIKDQTKDEKEATDTSDTKEEEAQPEKKE